MQFLFQYLVSYCCQSEYGAGARDLIILIVGLAVEIQVCDNIGAGSEMFHQTNVCHRVEV